MTASHGPKSRAALLAITLGAFALRVYHLASQSLWYDEAFSAYLARLPLAEITSLTAGDIHPPLYYYLLHFWVTLAGSTEFALRFLSAVASTLTVPAVFLLTLELGLGSDATGHQPSRRGVATALAVAAITAISPAYVWYAQEARMYALLTLLGVLTSISLLRWLQRPDGGSNRDLVAWCALSVTAVYIHFYAFFLVVFQVTFAAWRMLAAPDRRARLRAGGATLAVVVLAYLPWLGFTVTRLGADVSYWEGTLKVDEIVSATFLLFSAGHTAAPGEDTTIALGYAALLAAGLVLAVLDARRRAPDSVRQNQLGFLLGFLALPMLLLLAVSYGRPKFHPRYLLMISPAFYILAARPFAAAFGTLRGPVASQLARRVPILLAVAFVVAAAVIPIRHYYANEVLARDDFRSVTSWIQENRGPNERVILSSGHMYPAVAYYLSLPTIRIPDERTLSTQRLVTYDVADVLNRELAGTDGVWVVLWQNEVVDPNGILLSVLEQQGIARPVAQSFWGIRLLHYDLPLGPRFVAAPPVETATDVTFAGSLRLAGYRRGTPEAAAPTELPITFYWLPGKAIADDLQVLVRLLDGQGIQWGFYEGRPAAYQHPSFRWQTGAMVPGAVRLALLPGTPPGDYRLVMSVYPAGAANRLEAANSAGLPVGQQPTLGSLRVGPEPQSVGLEAARQGFTVVSDHQMSPDLRLVAYSAPPDRVRLGDILHLSLLWQVTAPTTGERRLVIRLRSDAGTPAGERLRDMSPMSAAPQLWPVGSIARTQTDYAIPADLSPGRWQLEVHLASNTGLTSEPVTLGELEVRERGQLPAPGTVQRPASVAFGGGITLDGYTVTPTHSDASVSLFWHTDTLLDRSYTVFVHLLDTNGRVVAQHDGLPVNGDWPTTAWPTGKVVQDTHILPIPAGLDPAGLKLSVGLYDAGTEDRLPMASGQGDSAILGILLDR